MRFELNGEDLTGADARLTQAVIERELSVGLLSRAAFHGQADITSLLEARSSSLELCILYMVCAHLTTVPRMSLTLHMCGPKIEE